MMPNVLKTQKFTPPIIPDRAFLHDLACAHAEEQFRLKGECAPTWLIATGPHVAWIETPFENGGEKVGATGLIRHMLQELRAGVYSFVTECWVGAFGSDMSDKERKHWMDFMDRHGVRSLPEHLRDDALMVSTIDKAGGHSYAKYLVTLRHGKGPNFLGPRMDESDHFTGMAGPMFNLFAPEKSVKETEAEAWALVQAARAAKQ